MNIANNANICAMNELMSTANAEMRQALVATQQHVAKLEKMINQGHQAPVLQPPAWAASAPPMGANQYYAARVHAAERAIQTFKNHLISGFCCTDSEWPLQLWNNLTKQALIILNL